MTEALDKVDIEKYLASATAAVIEQHQKAVPANICAKLVERINAELPDKCPSVDNYKYVVHATVQVRYFINILVAAATKLLILHFTLHLHGSNHKQ